MPSPRTAILASCVLAACGAPENPGVQPAVRFVAAPGSPIAVGPMPAKPIVADMNGDGRPDIAVPCGHGPDPKPRSGNVAVLLNLGAKGFERADVPPVPVGASVPNVAVGDVDGDGDIDAVTNEHDTYLVTVLLNDGKGRWSVPGPPVKASNGTSPHSHAVELADLNGDRRPDVLASNADDNTVSVLLGDGKAGFTRAPGSPFSTGRHPYDEIAVADMNADGHPDAIVPLLEDAKIAVLLGDGTGALTSPANLRVPVGARPGSVAVGDLNGDKLPDVAASHDDVGMIDILLNDGTGRLKPADGSPVRVDFPAWGMALADVDGDGCCDLVLGAAVGTEIAMLLGDGRGA